ncbi:hypothetical protein QFZ34_003231 [Phyllobacterium ifriqiyense]|uniref:Uncharacterized protein n=1 Tax=Phyllobacterium ifriqiyense TaxID=314238 RepID=A0ABU0SBB8_9HYPH|nr:hypothetical protein [Phyllobacterium ifriqiyense]
MTFKVFRVIKNINSALIPVVKSAARRVDVECLIEPVFHCDSHGNRTMDLKVYFRSKRDKVQVFSQLAVDNVLKPRYDT